MSNRISLTAAILLAAIGIAHAESLAPLNLDRWPEGWTVEAKEGSVVGVVEVAGSRWLEIKRDEGGVGAIAFWNGPTGKEGRIGDLSGSVILNTGKTARSDAMGIVIGARAPVWNNHEDKNNHGFVIGLIPDMKRSGSALFGIWQNVRTTQTEAQETPLSAAAGLFPSETVSKGRSVLLEFSVKGEQISASLWELDEREAKTGSALAEVAYTAGASVSGFFGIKGGRFGNKATRYFRDLKLEVGK